MNRQELKLSQELEEEKAKSKGLEVKISKLVNKIKSLQDSLYTAPTNIGLTRIQPMLLYGSFDYNMNFTIE